VPATRGNPAPTNNNLSPQSSTNVPGTTLNLYSEYTGAVLDGSIDVSEVSLLYKVWVGFLLAFPDWLVSIDPDEVHNNENFKPAYSITVRVPDTSPDPQTVYQSYIDDLDSGSTGGTITQDVFLGNALCDDVASTTCDITDVQCGVQKAFCWAVIGDVEDNINSITQEYQDITRNNLPFAIFFTLYDSFENSTATTSIPISVPISRLEIPGFSNDIVLLDLANPGFSQEMMDMFEEFEWYLLRGLYIVIGFLFVRIFINYATPFLPSYSEKSYSVRDGNRYRKTKTFIRHRKF
jgi:hypothetical protein